MSPCGCKKKTIVSPAQQPARVIIVENGEVKSIPAPSPIVPPQDVNKIVEKLNEILTPQ